MLAAQGTAAVSSGCSSCGAQSARLWRWEMTNAIAYRLIWRRPSVPLDQGVNDDFASMYR